MPSNLNREVVLLNDQESDRLRKEAYDRRLSKSAILRHALEKHFNQLDGAAKRNEAAEKAPAGTAIGYIGEIDAETVKVLRSMTPETIKRIYGDLPELPLSSKEEEAAQ